MNRTGPHSTARNCDVETCGKVNTAIEKMISDGSWQAALDKTVGASGFKPDTKSNPPKPAACA